MLATEAGRIAWRAQLDVYGVPREEQGVAAAEERTANPWRFPGQYEDSETGLHYNRFRYYDPELGRYLSEDPIGLSGGVALFGYVQNPQRSIDPFGRSGECAPKRPKYVPVDDFGAPLPLPRTRTGELVHSSLDPHTQIGWNEGRRGGYIQTREFGEGGVPVKQVDWTDHGRPALHTDPHVHDYIPNPTGGSPQHGAARPPTPGEFE